MRILSFAVMGLMIAALASCSRQAEEPPAAPTPAFPLSYSHKDANAEVSLTLPEAIARFPALHESLYSEGETELKSFTENTTRIRADLAKDGFDSPAYFRKSAWHLSGETDRLASFYAEHTEYTGGAHGNMNFETLLWDKTAGAPLKPDALFAPNADFRAADAYLCTQVEAERSRRNETPTRQNETSFPCPKLLESRVILIPSTITDKFGALEALYAPYDVGPYAEGAYRIRIPQNIVRGLIAPDLAENFAGEAIAAPADVAH